MKWLDTVKVITNKYENQGVKKGAVGTILMSEIRNDTFWVVFSDTNGKDYAELNIKVFDLELVKDNGLTDADILNGVVSTGFFDDEVTPDWQKEYVSTGVRDGIVNGYPSDSGAVFSSDSDITKAEAVAMLSRTLKLSDVSYVNLSEGIPAWIEQDTANLYANDIVTNVSAMDAPLTRADAAMMLSGALDIG